MQQVQITHLGWIYDAEVTVLCRPTATSYYHTADGLEQDLGDDGELEFTISSIMPAETESDLDMIVDAEEFEGLVWAELETGEDW